MEVTASSQPRRELGTAGLTLYGVGVIVGAGIYVLVGQVVQLAGEAGWLAFLAASIAALPTGLSYAELASRYPQSAGEALFAQRAFGHPAASFLVGFVIAASGLMSTAAVSHGFADYMHVLLGDRDFPRAGIVVAFLTVLSAVNFRGIRESTWFNATCTILSVAALVALALAGAPRWSTVIAAPGALGHDLPWGGLLAATALAFYAFIGFEDICNVADEVRRPARSIPRAIVLALGISTVVYVAVALTVVAVVPIAEIGARETPLVRASRTLFPDLSAAWLGVVALLAVSNTALVNLIMASRVLYGMGRHGWLPRAFAHLSPSRRTPTWGVGFSFVLAVVLALTGVLRVLAEATNVVILLAFATVDVSLLVVRLRRVPADDPEEPHFRVPLWVPSIGAASTVYLLTQFSAGAYMRAASVLAVGIGLHLVVRLFSGQSVRCPSQDGEGPG